MRFECEVKYLVCDRFVSKKGAPCYVVKLMSPDYSVHDYFISESQYFEFCKLESEQKIIVEFIVQFRDKYTNLYIERIVA